MIDFTIFLLSLIGLTLFFFLIIKPDQDEKLSEKKKKGTCRQDILDDFSQYTTHKQHEG